MKIGNYNSLLPTALSNPSSLRDADWEPFRHALAIIAGIVCLWFLSKFVWLLVPVPVSPVSPLSPSVLSYADRSQPQSDVDIAKIRSWNLFGAAGPKAREVAPEIAPAPVKVEIPLTTILVGILYSSNPDVARAILRHKTEEGRYAIGDDLPEGDIVVESIARDHIVVRRENGRRHTLNLYQEKTEIPTELRNPQQTVDNTDNPKIAKLVAKYRSEILNDTARLSYYLRFRPERRNGKLIGYRIRARRDLQNFRKLGFKNNDIIIGINGVILDNIAALASVHTILAGSGPYRFHLLRKKDTVDLSLSLP